MDFGTNNKHILLVINACTDSDTQLINKARHLLVSGQSTRFSLLLVVPAIPARSYQLPSVNTMQCQLLEQGKQKMAHVAELFGVAETRQMISFGTIKHEIDSISKQHPIDDIITDSDENKTTFADDIYAIIRSLGNEPCSFWSRFFNSYFASYFATR